MKACHPIRDDVLNVHLVPHSHDDTGWLKTVDQYFYGSNNTIWQAGVQYILDSVVTELEKDTARKFSFVEIAFFWQWWRALSEMERNRTRKLVENGQLEFLLGGWSGWWKCDILFSKMRNNRYISLYNRYVSRPLQ